jgi:hypothetical protein
VFYQRAAYAGPLDLLVTSFRDCYELYFVGDVGTVHLKPNRYRDIYVSMTTHSFFQHDNDLSWILYHCCTISVFQNQDLLYEVIRNGVTDGQMKG